MTSTNRRFVTGISSVSGGGKTSVSRRLADLLDDSVILCFDDYDNTNIHPENLPVWLIKGGDYNAWRTPVLTKDLQALTTGEPIKSPIDGSEILPAEHIIFDAPLGRAHSDTGRFIDFLVFIDTPLDVAMARRLLRDFANTEAHADTAMRSMEVELRSYLNEARQVYLEFQDRIKLQSDLVLDGCLSPDELAGEIRARVAG